eukprot:gene2198-2399_t
MKSLFQLQFLFLVCLLCFDLSFTFKQFTHNALAATKPFTSLRTSTSLNLASKDRQWSRKDLGGEDIFEDDSSSSSPSSRKDKEKKKFKLEPEQVFFEGPPSATEMIIPGISILTVIGIVPFVASVIRQFWVRYRFTSRRISIRSGFQGKTVTEIIYPDVEEIKYVNRLFGSTGDMVLFLRDGAKVEMRHVPRFPEIYKYVFERCDEDCKTKSMKPAI